MSYEFGANELRSSEVATANNYSGPSFNELLMEDIKKKSDPTTWNPFLMPKVEFFDSKNSDPKRQKAPTEVQSSQVPGVSEQPKNEGQVQEEPKKDGTEQPKLPGEEVPQKIETQKNEVRGPQKNELPGQPKTDVPGEPKTDGTRASSEQWGRFGRQFEIDTTGNAVYEVRNGDTYSAVARDVLEKRNGRVYDVKNSADRNEILKYSRELADLNGVQWGRNNFVLIHPGDKIRIPGVQKADVKPGEPPEAKREEPKREELKNDTAKPKEPSVVAGAFSIQPQDKLYSLLQPPGFEGQPGQSWNKELKMKGKSHDIENRFVQSSGTLPTGEKQFVYSGTVDTGFVSTTDFQAAEIVDKNNRIIARKIQYAEPIKMRLNAPSSQNNEVRVMAVQSLFDEKTGTYEARYLTKDGQVFAARYSGDGSIAMGVIEQQK